MTHEITKACKVCGEIKPLTAFLQMPGAKGGIIYGDKCADCRKAMLEQLKQNEREDTRRSGGGYKIDANAKIASDAAKADSQQEIEVQYHEERHEDEQKESASAEKTQQIAQKERDHRERVKEEIAASAEDALSHEKNHEPSESSNPQLISEHQAKEGKIDLKVAVLDAGQAKVAYQSAAFQNFKKLLGASSFLVSQAERAAMQHANSEGQPTKTAGASKAAESAKASTPQEAQQGKSHERKMNNLFSSLSDNKAAISPTTDPIEYAKQATLQSPTKRGPK